MTDIVFNIITLFEAKLPFLDSSQNVLVSSLWVHLMQSCFQTMVFNVSINANGLFPTFFLHFRFHLFL